MSVFLEVMQEELRRAKSHVEAFRSLLDSLPKGYVSILMVSGKRFAYRKWREGSHIKSHYLGLEGSSEEQAARKNYAERKRILANLKEAEKEEKRLEKALKNYEKE
jgi:hypothetical protein